MNGSSSGAPGRKTFWTLLRFYAPLALQTISQCLAYPLVGSVVAHGRLGPQEFADFAQGQTMMFFIGAIGGGLITTGMVFARSKTGMRNYLRMNRAVTLAAGLLQLLCCIPPFDRWVFGGLMGLAGDHLSIARNTMLLCLPMNLSFFLRNPYLATLLSEKRSVIATTATMIRIALTLALSFVFVQVNLVGWHWGALVSSLPVFLETYLCRVFAKPSMDALTDDGDAEKAPVLRQLRFSIPLAFGAVLLCGNGIIVATFLGQTADPDFSRAIHYVVWGIVSPLGAAALRLQTVTISFPPSQYGFGRVQTFALAVGVFFGLVSLAGQIPAFSNWYFGTVQNLSPDMLPFARRAVLILFVFSIFQALRGHAEGLAALRRRPNTILAANASYVATMTIALMFLIHSPVNGCYIGIISSIAATMAAVVTLRIALLGNDLADQYGVTHAHPTD